LAKGKLRGVLAEIKAGGFGNTVNIPAPFNDVEVYLVHAVLAYGVCTLHEPYDEDFLQLPDDGFIAVEENVLYQLHGNGAAAPFEGFFFEIDGNGRSDGFFHRALVAEKRRVFGGENGIFEARR